MRTLLFAAVISLLASTAMGDGFPPYQASFETKLSVVEGQVPEKIVRGVVARDSEGRTYRGEAKIRC